MANKDPSRATRFQPGKSGNPGGKPRPKPPVPLQDASPAAGPENPPRALKNRVVDRLAALVDDPDTDPAILMRACRLVASKDLASTIREMELESEWRAQEPQRLARDKRLLDGVAEYYPDLSSDDVERLTAELKELLRPQDLTSELKHQLGYWKSPPITTEDLTRIWCELGLPGDPGPAPEKPRPRPGGLIELPAPDPDQAILSARHVDQERHRRGQNVPEPPSVMKVEPEPTKPPVLPKQEQVKYMVLNEDGQLDWRFLGD